MLGAGSEVNGERGKEGWREGKVKRQRERERIESYRNREIGIAREKQVSETQKEERRWTDIGTQRSQLRDT